MPVSYTHCARANRTCCRGRPSSFGSQDPYWHHGLSQNRRPAKPNRAQGSHHSSRIRIPEPCRYSPLARIHPHRWPRARWAARRRFAYRSCCSSAATTSQFESLEQGVVQFKRNLPRPGNTPVPDGATSEPPGRDRPSLQARSNSVPRAAGRVLLSQFHQT